MNPRKSPPASAPIVIKEGSVSVSIYPTINRIYRPHPVTGQRELKSAHEQFTLAYYQGNRRVKRKFTDLATAKLEAEAVVQKLANGETEALKLTGKDRASYVAATQELHKWRADANLQLVVADYVAAARRLPDNVPLQEAVNFYLKRHPTGLAQRTVRQVLDELIKSKTDAGKSDVYIKDLRGRVGHFADAFQVPISSITGQQVDDYIRARGKAPRTQNNIRRLVATLFKFAVRRGYLPKDHDEMSAVEKAAEGAGVAGEPRDAGLLGRETKGEVVLVSRLRAALERLNSALPPEAITAAVDELTRDRSAMSLEAANREVYRLLKEGIPISVSDKERGGQKAERVRVIDWSRDGGTANNDFLLVSQFSVTGALYTCRPDLVGFVNGLPLVVIELKKPGVPARAAFDENLTHYKAEIPQLFWFNALLIASNGTDSRVGSLTADWERFFEWKRIEREDEPRRVSLEVMIRGTCDIAHPEGSRLLDLVENFTLFSEHKAGLVKIIGQNHQFIGVNNAIASMLKARQEGHGRGGVFWQTQGSGKSFSMVFFAQKILRKVPGNWSFVVVTDRVELDDQISKTFAAAGAVSDAAACHAASGAHLRDLLRGNQRYVFTLIHKFQPERLLLPAPTSAVATVASSSLASVPSQMPVLCDKRDVIVLTDEAHRSQYDTLAVNMRTALPNALFMAFTGTPLMAGEERTRDVFGDYVSIYDFQQSVEDGATAPLFYENRTPELQIENPDLNEDLYEIIEQADLDPAQGEKLERELSRQYHLITRDDRLDTIAQDLVRHFLGRGFQGKAMVVSIDKATALRMFDKVRKYWAEDLAKTQKALKGLGEYGGQPPDPEMVKELQKRLEVLQTTDMAVIVSAEQNEVEKMKQRGLDIIPHRQRMHDEELDEKFKDTADPLRLVFVCAMWLTGFDAPSCSTVYLDKPMRNHTLMQTIARANRVFPGKHSGVIVDYANVFTALEKALAIYGHGKGGDTPVRDKQKLVADLRRAIAEALAFCRSHGEDIAAIDALPPGNFERLERIGDAVNKFVSPDPLRKEFFIHTRLVSTLYDAVKPDPAIVEFSRLVTCLLTIADSIVTKINPGPVDISKVMGDVTKLLDESITGAGMPSKPAPVIDLSKIDFEALRQRLKESKQKNSDLEVLKAAIRAQLEKLIRLNKTRVDFLAKFEELVESYNNGSRTIEELLEELLKLSRSMSEEQQRHVREKLSEEELVIFDILTRPEPELSPEERAEVKRVARDLLLRLKALLVLNWRQKTSARSSLKLAIEDVLDTGLPRVYTPEIYQSKCGRIFEHFYESYTDRDANIYEEAG